MHIKPKLYSSFQTHSRHDFLNSAKIILKHQNANLVRFHKLCWINELGYVKRNLARGWCSVGYVTHVCGCKQRLKIN